MFGIIIINLDAGSYLRMTREKALAKAEKDKKDLYLQVFLERRRSFTPMVYSENRIPGSEALSEQKSLATLIRFMMNQEYSELCGFRTARMLLEIVRSNSLLLCGPRDKEVRIC